jgi:hypothetical protein
MAEQVLVPVSVVALPRAVPDIRPQFIRVRVQGVHPLSEFSDIAEHKDRSGKAVGAQAHRSEHGNTDKLIITTKEKAYVYCKSTGEFLTGAEDGGIKSAQKIKGIGLLNNGDVIFTRPQAVIHEEMSETFLTDCMVYWKKEPDGTFTRYRLVSDDFEIYKVRVMRAEYQ